MANHTGRSEIVQTNEFGSNISTNGNRIPSATAQDYLITIYDNIFTH